MQDTLQHYNSLDKILKFLNNQKEQGDASFFGAIHIHEVLFPEEKLSFTQFLVARIIKHPEKIAEGSIKNFDMIVRANENTRSFLQQGGFEKTALERQAIIKKSLDQNPETTKKAKQNSFLIPALVGVIVILIVALLFVILKK